MLAEPDPQFIWLRLYEKRLTIRSSITRFRTSNPPPPPNSFKNSLQRIRNVYAESKFFPSRIRIFPILDPGYRIRIEEFYHFNPKKCFRALGNIIRFVHPVLDPAVKRAPDPGSRIRIRNTVKIQDQNLKIKTQSEECPNFRSFQQYHSRTDLTWGRTVPLKVTNHRSIK